MAETHYPFGPGSYNIDQLTVEVSAAGLPAPLYINGSGYAGQGSFATAIDVVYGAPLLPAQVSTLNATVAAHLPAGPRKSRPLYSIRSDVQALSATQMSATWQDLSAAAGPVPRKYLGTTGPNAATLFHWDHTYYVLGGTAAQLKAAQISITATYIQDPDNWHYLMHPPWDSSIAIDGSEPVA